MIRCITIENLRGIRNGSLKDLTPLVVLVGPNSAGKSTILDALLIGVSPAPQAAIKEVASRRRGLEHDQRWLLFTDRGSSPTTARIEVRSDSSEPRTTEIAHKRYNREQELIFSSTYPSTQRVRPQLGVFPATEPSPPLPDVPEIKLVDPDSNKLPLDQLYSLVAERGLANQAKSIVQELIPDLDDIEILTPQGKPVVNLTFRNGARPLPLVGDGVRLLVQQSLELAAPISGTILLEEPEVHMHPAAIRQVAKAILAAVSRGIQVVITTHSLELIDSLLAESKPEKLDDIAIYRLNLSDGTLKSSRLSGSEASFSRNQIQEDLR